MIVQSRRKPKVKILKPHDSSIAPQGCLSSSEDEPCGGKRSPRLDLSEETSPRTTELIPQAEADVSTTSGGDYQSPRNTLEKLVQFCHAFGSIPLLTGHPIWRSS